MKRTFRCIVAQFAVVGTLAALLLGPETAFAAVAEQVQSGTVVNAANGTQVVNISGVDPATSFLIFETRHNSNRPVGSVVRGRIPIGCANPCTTIEFVRVTNEGAPTTINIQWYVVTFSSGVRVQRGEVAQDQLVKNVTIPLALTAVNQAFVIWSKSPAATDTSWEGNDSVVGEITTATNLQFRTDLDYADHIITWQIVEYLNAVDINVQKGSITTMGTGTTSRTATLSPAVDVNKTFVLAALRSSGAPPNIGGMMIRAQLTNSTTITIDRSTAGTPAIAVTEIFWQAIELKDTSVVVRGSSSFAAGVAQATVPMAPHLDTSRAIAFGSVNSGGGQNLGRSPYVGDDILGVGAATMALSATQLTLNRNSTVAAADIGWFVVEFEQADEARVLSGSYTGDGSAARPMIPVGFVPDVVIVTGNNNQNSVIRTSTMAGPDSKPMIGAVSMAPNLITSIDAANQGFTVGADARVNANGTMYYWTAFSQGPGKMKAGSYTGNGLAAQALDGLGFSPEAIFVMAEDTNNPVFRTSGHVNSFQFGADAGAATRVTSLAADGFTVGTNTAVNAAGVTYHYVAWNQAAGYLDVGSYTGNNTDNRNITGVGFSPELLVVKNIGAQPAVHHPDSLGSAVDSSLYFQGTAAATNRIQALQMDGFQVGNTSEVNQNAVTHLYLAWKRQSQPQIATGDYTGNPGLTQQVVDVGFSPDVVIVTTSNQIAAIRTSTMPDNTTKLMTGTAAITATNNTQMIRSLDVDGFTVGSRIEVNSNTLVYYFTAFKAAPGTMTVGTYVGNGSATTRRITGIGFSPELVFVMSAAGGTGHEAIHGSTAFTNGEEHAFAASAGNTVWISTFDADGFTLATADAHVNAAGATYHYIAWNEIPGQMDVGSYAGLSPADNKNITGVGFEPEYVIVKQFNDEPAVHHPASLGRAVDLSLYFSGTATAANLIQALQPDGFQVGSHTDVNESGTYAYYAWKRPFVTLTAVGLTAFSATRYERGVLSEWRTGYEIENLGFHLYREVEGRRTRVTASMVAGSGLRAGQGAALDAEQRYVAWDLDGASVDPSAVYWLEDVDFNGRRTWHGPVTPVEGALEAPPNATASTLLRNLGKGQGQTRREVFLEPGGRPERRGDAGASSAVTGAPGARSAVVGEAGARSAMVGGAEMQLAFAAQAAVKISVDRPGWYRVTQPELVTAGLAPGGNPGMLQLFVDGVEQAMLVTGDADGRFDPADAIEFYGTGVDTPYTNTRTYWLVADSGPGRRITIHPRADSPGPAITAGSFDFTLQQKERSIYWAALRNGDEENWFGALVSEEPADLLVDLSNIDAAGAAELEIAIQGVTNNPGADADHVVAIVVNGTEIGELRFDGQALGVQSFAIPSGILIEGANTVTVVARGGEQDISMVDLIRVRYAHAYIADADLLHFTADGPGTITIGGFTDSAVRVIDMTDPLAAEELLGAVGPDGGLWAVTIDVPGSGPRTLLAFTDATVAASVLVRANVPSSLRDGAADYLAVSHAAFADALGPLAEQRERDGLSVARIDIEDVYDEFSFGQKTPQALKDFVRYAHANWTPQPRFLLLVGDATIDPRDYAGFGDADFVPTKQVPMDGVALETASDDWFVDVDDDGLPDMAVGRLPVRTLDQAQGIVAKTLAYEAEGAAPWMNDILFVADHDEDALSPQFETESRRLAALLPEEYRAHELFSSRLEADVLRQMLADQVAEGRLIVNYAGHGSTQLWGVHGNLLGPDDVNGWTNSRLPIIIALNCLNGLFQGIYDEESLAETLLRAPRGGAVAVWASSGVTDPAMQAAAARELYRLIFQGAGPTLGEMVAAAKRVVSDRDVRRSWIFFGDPAMRLNGIAASDPQPMISVGDVTVAEGGAPSSAVFNVTLTPASLVTVTVNFATANGTATAPADYESQSGVLTFVPGVTFQTISVPINVDAVPELTETFVLNLSGAVNAAIADAQGVGTIRDTDLRLAVPNDVDGDGKADLVVFRPSSGTWLTLSSSSGFTAGTSSQFGSSGDLPQPPGDYDRDGLIDVVVFRPANATWYAQFSSGAVGEPLVFGRGTDIPVLGDYDGDRVPDAAVYRPSTGVWSILTSSGDGVTPVTYTLGGSTDIPVPADYDGDSMTDVAVYHPNTGVWTILTSSSGYAASSTFQWGLNGDVPVLGDYDGDGLADIAVYRPATGTWFICESSTDFTTSRSLQWGLNTDVPVPADYDGDGRTDLGVFRPSTGMWFIRHSTTGYLASVAYQWGRSGDIPLPNLTVATGSAISRRTVANLMRTADLDGDGHADLTVYRPSTGTWRNLKSSTNYTSAATFEWGESGDIPVSSDYDGDGVADLAVWQPSTGTWRIRNSSTGFVASASFQWGLSGDVPVPGDYDGDGTADLAVWRPSGSMWFISGSSTDFASSTSFQWGLSDDVPVQGDYDGDGLTDLGVFRPSTGTWFIRQSSTGYATSVSFQWGLSDDITVPGDYDGDGKTDLAVYRPSSGTWFIRQSSTGYTTSTWMQWGLSSDVPVPGDFDGDGKTDVAVFRPSAGTWFLLMSSTNFSTFASYEWGLTGDVPILKRP